MEIKIDESMHGAEYCAEPSAKSSAGYVAEKIKRNGKK